MSLQFLLCGLTAFTAGSARRSENLNPVVSKIDDDYPSFGRDGNPGGTVHLAGLDTGLAERAQKRPIRTEHLHPMIPRVRHDDVTFGVYGYPLRPRELPVAVALVAEKLRAVKVVAYHDDAVIVEVGHYHVACNGKRGGK